jgi:hypothetical protein
LREDRVGPKDTYDKTIRGWIRPLSIPSIMTLTFDRAMEDIDSEMLVRNLCRELSEHPEAIKKRYLRLSADDLDIFMVPSENIILKKIILPLKSAKQAFSFADFIAVIALCGMVCEMAMIFLCELAASVWDTRRLGAEYKKMFEGKKYERLSQERLVKALQGLGIIPDNLAEEVNVVRVIRQKYRHIFGKDYDNLEQEAFVAYTAAFRIVRSLVALPLGTQKKLTTPAQMRSYLELKGASTPHST